MSPLTVVTWKWRQPAGYHKRFGAEQVNVLAALVRRHYRRPHRFVCVTDDPAGVKCETMPLWDDFADVPNACGAHLPSCYRRLKLFAPEARQLFGPRVVSLDLDVLPVGDLVPLWDRPESFVGWGRPGSPHPLVYNGSMWLLRTGAHVAVWKYFDPARSPAMARDLGFLGSDQAWMSLCLGRRAHWTEADGVYSWPSELDKRGGALPSNARVVVFNGRRTPWDPVLHRRAPWIAEHWRE